MGERQSFYVHLFSLGSSNPVRLCAVCYTSLMDSVEVVVLNGSPGSGKSTLADAVAEQLRATGVRHAVIDLDEFARVYPSDVEALNSLKWQNLSATWPNYTTIGELKVIIPVLIDTTADLESLKQSAPSKSLTICTLTAPIDVLKSRVTTREPNEYWQERLRGLVERYAKRSDSEKFADFEVSTHNKQIGEAATEIISHLGWIPTLPKVSGTTK